MLSSAQPMWFSILFCPHCHVEDGKPESGWVGVWQPVKINPPDTVRKQDIFQPGSLVIWLQSFHWEGKFLFVVFHYKGIGIVVQMFQQ